MLRIQHNFFLKFKELGDGLIITSPSSSSFFFLVETLKIRIFDQELARIIEESKEEQAQRRSKGIVIKEHN
ncbi:hypothetical protein GQ457_16G019870 [Hibiscus cannabinus]